MARRYPRYSAERWAKLILEQQSSDVPVDVFCARKSVVVSTFNKWRRRLQGEFASLAPEPTLRTRGFVEALAPANQLVSLVLAGGVRLELPVALDPQSIAELAHAVATRGRGCALGRSARVSVLPPGRHAPANRWAGSPGGP